MKKLIPTISLIFCSIWLVSCSNSQTDAAKQTPSNTVEQIKTETSPKPVTATPANTTEQPKIGTIKELVNGDLKCYATLVDENGKEHNLGASFEVCEPEKFLNKKVSLSYGIESVSDCQSAEPCGKSKKESLIVKIDILGEKSPTKKN
ncbi:hypothetical protein [Cylindrospermum sp. FACHB-282]|uniref:hypothetical protein n=1 Tax=Cylindrospermum sp. FACHB-282 TaxID=2692794 RepID=UPI00168461C7|nr:hypothetical protein [Cylindrospermum sp. FACHB-282]MBD2388614.1 hypothetical protein [Cylindrospermum sp. FACHB-282]